MLPITLIAISIYKFYILFTLISYILINSTPIFFISCKSHKERCRIPSSPVRCKE